MYIPPDSIIVQVRGPLLTFLQRLFAMRFPNDAAATSWWRSVRHNAAVGGDPRSQHLIATAIDVTTSVPHVLAAEARRVGLVAVVEPDHVHLQHFGAAQSPVARVRLV